MFALNILLLEVFSEIWCTLIVVNTCHRLVEKQFKVLVILFVILKCVESMVDLTLQLFVTDKFQGTFSVTFNMP